MRKVENPNEKLNANLVSTLEILRSYFTAKVVLMKRMDNFKNFSTPQRRPHKESFTSQHYCDTEHKTKNHQEEQDVIQYSKLERYDVKHNHLIRTCI